MNFVKIAQSHHGKVSSKYDEHQMGGFLPEKSSKILCLMN
jgi:hypothetical protein